MIQTGSFANLANLNALWLCENQINIIQPGSFINLTNLEVMSLSYNQITMIQAGTFANLPRLRQLSLSHNKLREIQAGTFENLPGLKGLHLPKNQITEIQPGSFATLPRLERVLLYDNQITMIQANTFANLVHLKRLLLNRNQIKTIWSGGFANMPGLTFLSLSSNQITNIHSGAFTNLSQLQHLDLQSNNMFAIAPLAYGLSPSIRRLNLDENPWHCDCRMRPFRLDTPTFPSFKDQIVCAQPAKLQGQKLADVNPEELICKQPTISTLPVDVPTPFRSTAVSTISSFSNTESNARPTAHSEGPTLPLVSPLGSSTRGDNDITSRYHWYCKTNTGSAAGLAGRICKARATLPPPLETTSDQPESRSSNGPAPSSPLLVLICSIAGSVTGIVLIGSIILTIWYKRRTRHPPLGLNPNHVGSNATTTVSVMTSGHVRRYEDFDDDQTGQGQSQAITTPNTNTTAAGVVSGLYEDIDTQHHQTEQGQSRAITQTLEVGNLSDNEVLAALKSNPMYADVKTPPRNPTATEIASGHDHNLTGHGQSRAITNATTSATASELTSGDEHWYEDMNQHNQTGRGQSQAIGKSNTNMNSTDTLVASGYDHQYEDMNKVSQTGYGQSQAITESTTHTTAASSTSGHGQAGYQVITESSGTKNPSYGTGPTLTNELNALYNIEGQYQAIVKSHRNTTAAVVSSHDQLY
ncbi:uncharacterized protein [Branchiostoma lanceolatum]|uniref:uncharacterized protein n=1 Tax=Branchiostoma lanceolatum TaxID=7740 RepID=UPI003452EDB1